MDDRASGDRRTSSPGAPMLVDTTSPSPKCENDSNILLATFC